MQLRKIRDLLSRRGTKQLPALFEIFEVAQTVTLWVWSQDDSLFGNCSLPVVGSSSSSWEAGTLFGSWEFFQIHVYGSFFKDFKVLCSIYFCAFSLTRTTPGGTHGLCFSCDGLPLASNRSIYHRSFSVNTGLPCSCFRD